MGFESLSRIGKKHALTYHKAKRILQENGLMDFDGKPTKAAFDDSLVESKMIESQYHNGELVEFIKWDNNKLAAYFKPVSEIDVFCLILNRHQACSKFRKLFELANNAFGWEELEGAPKNPAKHKIYSELTYHIYETPLVFLTGEYDDEIESFFDGNRETFTLIHKALKKVDAGKAEFFQRGLAGLKGWLLTQTRKR